MGRVGAGAGWRRAVGAGVLSAALACALLGGCSGLFGSRTGTLPGPAVGEKGPPYEVTIAGVDDVKDLKNRLTAASRLESLKDRPPLTEAGLRRRVDEDVTRFDNVLRAEGYYDASIEPRIEGSNPIRVMMTVNPGPRFRLAAVEVDYQGAATAGLPGSMADVGLEPGAPARSDDVIAAEGKLIQALARRGRPLAAIKDRKAVVDHANQTMTVTLQVDPGPPAQFGDLRVDGLHDVDEPYIRRFIPWRRGDVYDQDKVETLRSRLFDTSLFQSVTVHRGDALAPDGTLPMSLELSEAKPRTIGAGINYSTDEGPGGKVFWTHRNLFGQGERIDLTAQASTILQRLSADFTNPNVGRLDQDFLLNGALERQDSDAYRSETLRVYSGIREKLSKFWSGEVGSSFEYGTIDDPTRNQGETFNFSLIGVPLKLSRDTRDDLLNPTRGTTLAFGLTPYFSLLNPAASFLDSSITGSIYEAFDDERRYVLAVRGQLESLTGANTRDIPATKRLYAGGGGSVRGYAYQKVGPLDSERNPIGGRSAATLSNELRIRLTDTMGVVPFVDGGLVNDPSLPDFSSHVFWGAGIGFRYYTAVGPVRADIAFPLSRRPDVDSLFEIYLSLGQSF